VTRVPPGDRPREKLARAGAAALGDTELVALLLGTGTAGQDAVGVAGALLETHGGAGALAGATLDDLCRIRGVGPTRAARLLAAVELGRRVVAGRSGQRPRMGSPRQVAEYLLPLFGGHRVERFGVVLLDAKHRLIRAAVLSVGSLDASIVHPREVFREAAGGSAAALVLFHNHPSGDPAPSAEDVLLTRRLVQAGELMGIAVVDHVILGEGRWFSFREGAPGVVGG
jgi:DNA repair protein RadC